MTGGDVGARIRALRHARQWTERELSARSGLCLLTISRLEQGHANFRRSTLASVAAALDTTAEQLLAGTSSGDAPDHLTATLLALWGSILPEHRRHALDVLSGVAAFSAQIRHLQAQLVERDRTHDGPGAP